MGRDQKKKKIKQKNPPLTNGDLTGVSRFSKPCKDFTKNLLFITWPMDFHTTLTNFKKYPVKNIHTCISKLCDNTTWPHNMVPDGGQLWPEG